ncbi:MAG: 4Fe-4S binding protein [Pseudomonadota bacterium]|nr:4Fe-4S binding protein [Pseudomonadota bacterium]
MTVGFESSSAAPLAGTAGSEIRDDRFTLESWGWSSRPEECAPKIAALASLYNLAPPDPVASVSYGSKGNLLIVAGDSNGRARDAAAALASQLHVTVLEPQYSPGAQSFAAWSGNVVSLTGYLGEFTATISGLRNSPAGAASTPMPAKFDLVLDFSHEALFAMRQPPQGYFHAPADDASLAPVLDELRGAVGEFEKPRYFAYRENICAHSRSAIEGCNACIEICSTQAISSDGDHVKVDPHLCMGCGACSTVCPSGAMSYQYPRVADRGAQLKQLLSAYRFAAGIEPCIVFHNGSDGRDLLAAAATAGAGLPARALPLETWHVAAIGLDLLLPAIAFGASQVIVLSAGSEDDEYLASLREQMAIGQAVLSQMGYAGTHFAVIEAATPEALARALAGLAPAQGVPVPGTFLLANDKRTAIEFAVEHLAKHAPTRVDEIALPAGAPYGQVLVDRAKCTMCMACVGSCPESALMDGVDQPLLKFLERNCVQCGLCENTCPEEAISLAPRLLLTPAVREARVLNETQPFHCVRCSKPFGTKQMVDAMTGRLAGHSMFAQADALRRLQMCADCRVVDMMSSKNELSVLKLGADS